MYKEDRTMSFGQGLLIVGAGLFALWFFTVWLPDYLHATKIGRTYGWPTEKQKAIERLFLDGTVTSVGYIGATYNPNEEFFLVVVGPFGKFVRKGTGNKLHTGRDSARLPPQVAEALNGYTDTVTDVVRLLCDTPFLVRLQHTGGKRFRICGDIPRSLAIVAV